MGLRTVSRAATALRIVRGRETGTLASTFARGVFPAWLFRWSHLLIEEIPTSPAGPPPGVPLRVRWATREDLDLLARIRPRERDYRRFFDQNCLCTVGIYRDEPIAMTWIELDRWHVSLPNGYRWRLPERSAWLFGTFIPPEHRGQGLYVPYFRAVQRLLVQNDVRAAYCAVQRSDHRSRRAHEKAGWRELFDVRVLRLAGLTLHAVRRLSPAGRPAHVARGLGPWVHRCSDP